MRVVKAFAREDRQLERFRGQRRPRLRPGDGLHAPAGLLQPVHRLPAPARAGGDPVLRRAPGHRRAPDASASSAPSTPTCSCCCRRCARSASRSAWPSARPPPAPASIQILDREPRIVSAARTRRRCRPARATSSCATSRCSYEGAHRARRCDDVDARRRRPGTTVALVGATGSGKTTLVQLLPRLYDVTAGAVLVDGADVRDVDVASLRRAIAVVDDDPFLFSATRGREHRLRARRRDARGDRARRAARAGPRLHRARCPTATTRASASAG